MAGIDEGQARAARAAAIWGRAWPSARFTSTLLRGTLPRDSHPGRVRGRSRVGGGAQRALSSRGIRRRDALLDDSLRLRKENSSALKIMPPPPGGTTGPLR